MSASTPLSSKGKSAMHVRKVLVIGTGGTIVSEPTEGGLAPIRSDLFFRRLRSHPQLTDPFSLAPPSSSGSASPAVAPGSPTVDPSLGPSSSSPSPSTQTPPPIYTSFSAPVPTTALGANTLYPALLTPSLSSSSSSASSSRPTSSAGPAFTVNAPGAPDHRCSYVILDLHTHLDSSEMTPREWNTIAELISDHWGAYDGFVVLSGTDTLAYTSSALAFLFTLPGKPILVTGAQVPLSQPRSDGWGNLLDCLVVVGTTNFAGVGVVFNKQVLHGARATKTSPNLFHAFSSPCLPPLISLNVKITAVPSLTLRSPQLPPRLVPLLTAPTVLSCSVHPGLTGRLLTAQTQALPDCRAVILSAYGSGNMPLAEGNGVLEALRGLVEREVLVVVISQCEIPAVYPLYTQGQTLLRLGVLPGYDLTHEAAFAKLLWLVSRADLSFREKQEIFGTPVAGEMSVGGELG